MKTQPDPFENRAQAGKELANALGDYRNTDCLVLAIPRGGVVVGYEVAQALNCELDVIVPRKIGAPNQPELAIGAIASWGDHEQLLDEPSIRYLGVTKDYLDREVAHQLSEINRRLVAYRGTNEPPDVAGRQVILVDDGIATGYTTRAAALAVRRLKAERIILAVPVAPPDSLQSLAPYVDETICLKTPTPFMAVGYWYRNFDQVTDEEVQHLLYAARTNRAQSEASD